MMKLPSICLTVVLTALVPGHAEERFAIVETDNGIVRIDRDRGTVSFCRETTGSMACSLAADERLAWEQENQRLRSRVADLEHRVVKLERRLTGPADDSTLSDEENRKLDRALQLTERAMRGFLSMMKELVREYESD